MIGDNGRFYVPKELVPIYQNDIIPYADIVTPNQFEAEILTNIQIKTYENMWNALDWFHEKGVKTVVITSSDLGPPSRITIFLSHKKEILIERYTLDIPKLGNGLSFGGTGDLFTALFMAHIENYSDVVLALQITASTVFNVIKNTIEHIPNEILCQNLPCTSEIKELKLIQSKNIIENQETLFLLTEYCRNKHLFYFKCTRLVFFTRLH